MAFTGQQILCYGSEEIKGLLHLLLNFQMFSDPTRKDHMPPHVDGFTVIFFSEVPQFSLIFKEFSLA